MSFPSYEQYKDSGVEWLGDVPAGWAVGSFKWEIARNDGGVWGDDPDGQNDTIVLRSTEQTVDGCWQIDDPATRKITPSEKTSALLAPGDLLVTKSSGSSLHIGKTTLVNDEIAAMECCYSNFMQRLRLHPSFIPKLAWYVMNNKLARAQFDYLSNSTTGLANLNGTMIGQILLTIPPLTEQHSIAAFLDRETAKIDALVAEQEKLITLLKEKRQAVISHAVTKGLDPNARMKDSGIEWLGEVPEGWEVVPIKHIGWLKGGAGFPHDEQGVEGEELSFHKVNALAQAGDDGVLLPSENTISRETASRLGAYIFPQMSIVFAKVGAALLLGRIRVISDASCLDNNMMGLVVKEDNAVNFVRYAMSLVRFDLISNPGTVPSLNESQIGNFRLAIPQKDEQHTITAFIDRETTKLDTLTAEAQRAIALLQERRTALISAAVTGKIDVRGLAPQEAA